MKLKLSCKFVVAFLALTFVMHEAHEIVHTTVGRIICGCWGTRDFNVWSTCEGCYSQHPTAIWSTFAGPIFTFIMIWIGAYFLRDRNSEKQKSFGFAMIFANLPFARILTSAIGGGDEVFGLGQLMENYNLAWAIGLSSVVLITFFPLYKAYKTIKNEKRIALFLLFFLVPTLIDLLLILGLMNNLMDLGLLNNYGILGSPVLVSVWTGFVIVILVIMRKHIYKLPGNVNSLKIEN